MSVMKRKTSVNIDEKYLDLIKREARKQDRSVSYILEKFLEEKARSIIAEDAPASKFKAKKAAA
jgi:hypothetical protein